MNIELMVFLLRQNGFLSLLAYTGIHLANLLHFMFKFFFVGQTVAVIPLDAAATFFGFLVFGQFVSGFGQVLVLHWRHNNAWKQQNNDKVYDSRLAVWITFDRLAVNWLNCAQALQKLIYKSIVVTLAYNEYSLHLIERMYYKITKNVVNTPHYRITKFWTS